MQLKKHIIAEVIAESPADRAGILKGQLLLSINGHNIVDVFDYRMLCAVKNPILQIEDSIAGLHSVTLYKEAYDDAGLVFDDAMMDDAKRCTNNCIFCFIDQLPEGLRSSLYFKDDDSRLSFLSGNYVTLTNITDDEIARIISHKLSPINISVHSTDPEIRAKMLRNRNAGNVNERIRKIVNAGISVNSQIVLLRGINDGENLDNTIRNLTSMYPGVESISVVPVGLTKHRDRLYKLLPFDKEASASVIAQVGMWQAKMLKMHGSAVVWLADEFYFNAGIELPGRNHYGSFPQIENGVGMYSLFRHQFEKAIGSIRTRSEKYYKDNIGGPKARKVSIVTGKMCADVLCDMTDELVKLVNGLFNDTILKAEVYGVENIFFGPQITVSGLLTGSDILNYFDRKCIDIGDELLLPENMFKSDEDVMLDDTSLCELSGKLGVNASKVRNDGMVLVKKILGNDLARIIFGHRYRIVRDRGCKL